MGDLCESRCKADGTDFMTWKNDGNCRCDRTCNRQTQYSGCLGSVYKYNSDNDGYLSAGTTMTTTNAGLTEKFYKVTIGSSMPDWSKITSSSSRIVTTVNYASTSSAWPGLPEKD